MDRHIEPPRWVKALSECNVSHKFDALSEIVKRDVDDANSLAPRVRGNCIFKFFEHNEGVCRKFEVTRRQQENMRDDGSIVFKEFENHIEVEYFPSKLKPCTIKPQWCDEKASCILRVDDSEREFQVWEVSQKFFGPLVFGLM